MEHYLLEWIRYVTERNKMMRKEVEADEDGITPRAPKANQTHG